MGRRDEKQKAGAIGGLWGDGPSTEPAGRNAPRLRRPRLGARSAERRASFALQRGHRPKKTIFPKTRF
jgi:hypothetical protein